MSSSIQVYVRGYLRMIPLGQFHNREGAEINLKLNEARFKLK